MKKFKNKTIIISEIKGLEKVSDPEYHCSITEVQTDNIRKLHIKILAMKFLKLFFNRAQTSFVPLTSYNMGGECKIDMN